MIHHVTLAAALNDGIAQDLRVCEGAAMPLVLEAEVVGTTTSTIDSASTTKAPATTETLIFMKTAIAEAHVSWRGSDSVRTTASAKLDAAEGTSSRSRRPQR